MGIRLLHTSDWHLGCPLRHVTGDAGALVRERRLEVVRAIAQLAQKREVDAVLVAGDVFDGQHVDSALLLRTLDALAAYSGPWILLPGNHDAALAESVWTRLARLEPPSNVHLALTAEPIPIGNGRAFVLPAPLKSRRTQDDRTAWMDLAPTPPGAVRIGLAHGLIEGLQAQVEEATNPIAADRVQRAQLDYLALGDRHGFLKVDARTWYSGTPEPDHYRYRDAGFVLLVELDGPGAVPRIEPIPTGWYHWVERALELPPLSPPELEARIAAVSNELPAPGERVILKLALRGSVDLAGRRAIDAALARLAAAVRHLALEDGLRLQPGAAELAGLDDGSIVGACARAIDERRRSAASEDERAVAELALRLLWQAVAELGQAEEPRA